MVIDVVGMISKRRFTVAAMVIKVLRAAGATVLVNCDELSDTNWRGRAKWLWVLSWARPLAGITVQIDLKSKMV